MNTGMKKKDIFQNAADNILKDVILYPSIQQGFIGCVCRIVVVFLRVSCGECSSGCWVVGHVSGLSPGRWGGGGCSHPSCKYIYKKSNMYSQISFTQCCGDYLKNMESYYSHPGVGIALVKVFCTP